MKPRSCNGALTLAEMQTLEAGTELRLYTCAVCGKRNLYPVKDPWGKWVPEPHSTPMPRSQQDRANT
jgi:hypothetical protein